MKYWNKLNFAQKMNILLALAFLFGIFCGMAMGISFYRNELVNALQECLSRDLSAGVNLL